MVFQESINAIKETTERLGRLTQQIEVLAPAWRMFPVLQAYQALRGVSLIVASTVVAELGDLTRFDNPKQVMAFLGLIPSEHSSGERSRKGGITKAGNGHARRVCSGQVKTYTWLSRFLKFPVLLFKLSWGQVSQVGVKTVTVIKHFNVLNDIPACLGAGCVNVMIS